MFFLHKMKHSLLEDMYWPNMSACHAGYLVEAFSCSLHNIM